MTDCNEAIRPIHHRMPVLLEEPDHERWIYGDLDDMIAFQNRCFPDELIVTDRTMETWAKRAPQAALL